MIETLASDFVLLRVKTQSIETIGSAFWIKEFVDGKFIMRYLNLEYERIFLIPNGKSRSDYIGNTDYDVWSEEIAKAYERHDFAALGLQGKQINFKEAYEYEGKVKSGQFIKICFKDELTERIFVSGLLVEL